MSPAFVAVSSRRFRGSELYQLSLVVEVRACRRLGAALHAFEHQIVSRYTGSCERVDLTTALPVRADGGTSNRLGKVC